MYIDCKKRYVNQASRGQEFPNSDNTISMKIKCGYIVQNKYNLLDDQ